MQVYNALPPMPPTSCYWQRSLTCLQLLQAALLLFVTKNRRWIFFFKLSPELPHSAINCGHCESSLSLSTCEFSVENVNFTYATYFSRGLARLAF